VLLSAVKVLRFSDGIRGGNLGLMYNLLLQLDEVYSSRIDGLPEKVRNKVIFVSCDTEGIRLFFFIFGLQHYFYFYLPPFFLLSSSGPVQTDRTRSSLKPVFFLYRHFYFSMFISKKKN
jgi:hypothetical protein